jgi:hypothetical protein
MVARPLDDAGLDALLRALASGPRALIPVAELPDRWGLDADDAVDTAAELVADGWLEEWIGADDQAVILSSRSAERLQIELHPPDSGNLRACKWVTIGSSRPAPPPRRGVVCETDLLERTTMTEDASTSFLDSQADLAAVDACRDDWSGITNEQRLSRPRLLIGVDHLWVHSDPYPAGVDSRGHCDACHGVKLGRSVYCLACDSTGAPLVAMADPLPERRRYVPDPLLCGGRGRKVKPKPTRPAKNSIRDELNALAAKV